MPENGSPRVAILMGSDSDLPKLESALETLREFGVPFTARVMSAHRTPQVVAEFAATAEERGIEVFIAAAGGAAHLAGVVAGHTVLPVIGIPIDGTALNGLDSLLSTVQMPAGIPVATVAVGGGGATNAALLAVAILAGREPALREKLKEYRRQLAVKVQKRDAELQKRLG